MATEVLVIHSERLSSCQIELDRISEGFGELKGKWGERDKMTEMPRNTYRINGAHLEYNQNSDRKWTKKIRSKMVENVLHRKIRN